MKKLLFAALFLALLVPVGSHAHHVVGFLIPSSGLGDHSFNDMTYAGLIKSRNTHHFRLLRQQCTDSSKIAHRQALEQLLAENANIIIVHGWDNQDLIEHYARQHPDRVFIINDLPTGGFDNIISLVYGQHEGAFLAGALASWMTKSGKVGFIGGRDTPVIRAFQTGFKEGVQFAGPNIELVETFLADTGEMSSGFNDPSLGFATANRLYQQGVDIIFGVAGLSGNGIIRAAQLTGNYVIGVDADQDHMAKGHVLTSVIKRQDKIIFDILNRIFHEEPFHGVQYFSLHNGGVTLSPMTFSRSIIPAEIQEKLVQLQQQILRGEIVVTDALQNAFPYQKPTIQEKTH